MQYFFTRLTDPDPYTGNRMIPAGAWFKRPKEMEMERAFMKDSYGEDIWHVIINITECGPEGGPLHLHFEDQPHIHVEREKAIYITEDQYERFVVHAKKKLISDTKSSKNMTDEQKAVAVHVIESMGELTNEVQDQVEIRTDESIKTLHERAWGIVDREGVRARWLPLSETHPDEMGDALELLELANRANPKGAPHRYQSYYS